MATIAASKKTYYSRTSVIEAFHPFGVESVYNFIIVYPLIFVSKSLKSRSWKLK